MQSFVFPGNLDRTIAAIGSEPIPYMRTQEFSMINLESEQILLDLIRSEMVVQSFTQVQVLVR